MKSCGEGFWLWPRRRGPSRTGQRSIPAAGCNDRANAGHGQKTRRPEGFRGKGRLASLLLGHRPLAGMLPRRASPCSLFPKNRTARNFQTRSNGPSGHAQFSRHARTVPARRDSVRKGSVSQNKRLPWRWERSVMLPNACAMLRDRNMRFFVTPFSERVKKRRQASREGACRRVRRFTEEKCHPQRPLSFRRPFSAKTAGRSVSGPNPTPTRRIPADRQSACRLRQSFGPHRWN